MSAATRRATRSGRTAVAITITGIDIGIFFAVDTSRVVATTAQHLFHLLIAHPLEHRLRILTRLSIQAPGAGEIDAGGRLGLEVPRAAAAGTECERDEREGGRAQRYLGVVAATSGCFGYFAKIALTASLIAGCGLFITFFVRRPSAVPLHTSSLLL